RDCGACCKGLGIGLDATAGQVGELTGHYPELIPFLRKRGDTWTAFNPRGNCWFIDGDGLCRIEVDHGRETKPASCRLFPFNRIWLLNSRLKSKRSKLN
ncbi:MAG: YkgJ family cysteine cluster protein, partial [Nitrospirota bacterium]